MGFDFRQLYEYEKDAHRQVLDSLKSVPEGRRTDASFVYALNKFAHIFTARKIWLHRLGHAEMPEDLFPTDFSLAQIEELIERVESKWTEYFAESDSNELARTIEYRDTEGVGYSNTVDEILTQLFSHSFYHRGQIASAIKQSGGNPVDTDFIYSVRRLSG